MKKRSLIIYFIWIQCFLYLCIQQNHATNARCSWGSWLPWNCTCCGNSHDITVYRIRAKCCDKTYECALLRSVALNITDENAFEETSSCSNDCGPAYISYNEHTCVSSKMNLMNDLNVPSKIKSCQGDTCIGTLTTTTTTATTSITTTYSSTTSESKPTFPASSQTSTAIRTSNISASVTMSTVSYTATTNVENIKSPDINYPVIFGSTFGGITACGIVIVIICCMKCNKCIVIRDNVKCKKCKQKA